MNVCEIFDSLQGEPDGFGGQGQPTTFVRLQGCNLDCIWCDTPYAKPEKEGVQMSVKEVLQRIHFKKVTITGGEPLLQWYDVKKLVKKLIEKQIKTTIETNGSIYFPAGELASLGQRLLFLRFVVDYKLPSSGMEACMNPEVYTQLAGHDVMKFVIGDVKDLKRMKRILRKDWKAKIVISPDISKGMELAKQAVEFLMKEERMQRASLSLQLHKLLKIR